MSIAVMIHSNEKKGFGPSLLETCKSRQLVALIAILAVLFFYLLLNQTSLLRSGSASSVLLPAAESDANSSGQYHGKERTVRQGISPQDQKNEDDDDDEKRVFQPYGSAAALFAVYGAYRGGSNTFAVVGLGSKPLYVFGKPEFECYWVPSSSSSTPNKEPIKSEIAYTMLPDYGYGRVYTVVVVNCTFQEAVGASNQGRGGGQLVLYASHGDGLGKPAERIVALEEDENSYNSSRYGPPYPYEFLYCGSPLFGSLNANRIREWIAYHVMLFGPKSHFIFHDAGGVNAEVRAVLEPWKKLGYITVQNVKQQSQYDGYYYNQFLILNDCLHRTKFMANWTFFFDVDEYIYIAPELTFHSVMDWHVNETMLGFQQLRMSDVLCQDKEKEGDSRWGFEKLVYGEKIEDTKYAVQARQVFATGVHYSQKELNHMIGEIGWAWWPQMGFYHYHNTISKHGELCMEPTNNATSFTLNGNTFKLDTSMVSLGSLVKNFELEQIGQFNAYAPSTRT